MPVRIILIISTFDDVVVSDVVLEEAEEEEGRVFCDLEGELYEKIPRLVSLEFHQLIRWFNLFSA